MTVTNNSPSSGYIAWSDLHLQYKGITYNITADNTDKKYSWWSFAGNKTILNTSNTMPTLTADDCLIFLNKAGVAIVVPGSTVQDGDLIVPGTIVAGHLASESVTTNAIKAGAVVTNSLAAGAITAAKIAAKAITTDKLFVADLTNMAQYDPDTHPDEYTTTLIGGLKYFKIGPSAGGNLIFAKSSIVEFDVGNKYEFKFNGYKEAGIDLLATIRYNYTDGTSSTAGSTTILDIPIGGSPAIVKAVVSVENAPTSGKTLSSTTFVVAKSGVDTVYSLYARALSLMRMTNGSLIVDGTITAVKIKADQITTNHLLANSVTAAKIAAGTITSDKIDVRELFANTAFVSALESLGMRLSIIAGEDVELVIGTPSNPRATFLFNDNGMAITIPGSTYGTITNSDGYHITQGGEIIASFAKRKLEVENIQAPDGTVSMKRAADGGFMFTSVN